MVRLSSLASVSSDCSSFAQSFVQVGLDSVQEVQCVDIMFIQLTAARSQCMGYIIKICPHVRTSVQYPKNRPHIQHKDKILTHLDKPWMQPARSLVITPFSTVSTQTPSNIWENLESDKSEWEIIAMSNFMSHEYQIYT